MAAHAPPRMGVEGSPRGFAPLRFGHYVRPGYCHPMHGCGRAISAGHMTLRAEVGRFFQAFGKIAKVRAGGSPGRRYPLVAGQAGDHPIVVEGPIRRDVDRR